MSAVQQVMTVHLLLTCQRPGSLATSMVQLLIQQHCRLHAQQLELKLLQTLVQETF